MYVCSLVQGASCNVSVIFITLKRTRRNFMMEKLLNELRSRDNFGTVQYVTTYNINYIFVKFISPALLSGYLKLFYKMSNCQRFHNIDLLKCTFFHGQVVCILEYICRPGCRPNQIYFEAFRSLRTIQKNVLYISFNEKWSK